MCPFLRLEGGDGLRSPGLSATDAHRCVAIAGPRVVSHQQQELECLRSAHVECPRYRRATAPASAFSRRLRLPAVPRATAVSLVILVAAAAVSFGFVVQRGGIDLVQSSPSASGIAAAATRSQPMASLPAATTAADGAPSASPSGGEASASAAAAQPTPATAPPSAAPSESPALKPSSSAPPTPRPPASSGVPSASRLAVLVPCAAQRGCFVYTIRAGDNLVSIAHWFGVPLTTIRSWNPSVNTGIHPGMRIRIPTPTR